MKKLWFLASVLFFLLCVGGCEEDCEGQSCSSGSRWCCANNVTECVDGVSRIYQTCSGCCEESCGPSGCSVACVSCDDR